MGKNAKQNKKMKAINPKHTNPNIFTSSVKPKSYLFHILKMGQLVMRMNHYKCMYTVFNSVASGLVFCIL